MSSASSSPVSPADGREGQVVPQDCTQWHPPVWTSFWVNFTIPRSLQILFHFFRCLSIVIIFTTGSGREQRAAAKRRSVCRHTPQYTQSHLLRFSSCGALWPLSLFSFFFFFLHCFAKPALAIQSTEPRENWVEMDRECKSRSVPFGSWKMVEQHSYLVK